MKHFTLTVTLPTGAVLVGGRADAPGRLHAAHARDANGAPMIPGTALRGALRETYERLLRGAHAECVAKGDSDPDSDACSGGDGYSPGEAQADRPVQPCTLDHGKPCPACQLFGSRMDVLEAEGGFSALRLGDAYVVQAQENQARTSWGVRPGVAITRARRSAEDGRLFMRQVPELPGLTLQAELWLLDDALESALRVVVENTRHLGGSRSRGLGRVDLALVPHPEQAPTLAQGDKAVSRGTASTDQDSCDLRLVLTSPAYFGTGVNSRYVMDTRPEIPGATVRGMLGFALARALPDPDQHAAFQALVHPETGAHFGYFYPARPTSPVVTHSAPMPMTVQTCKSHKLAHGWQDSLLDQICLSLITSTKQLEAREIGAHKETACRECGSPFRRAEGYRRTPGKPRIQSVTRVSLNRSWQSAEDGQLFSQRLVSQGACYEGRISHIPPGGLALLEVALEQPLVVGRGHAYGWGQCTVTRVPAHKLPLLKERRKDFQNRLRAALNRQKLDATRATRLISMTLLSPTLPADEAFVGQVEETLKARLLLKLRRFAREGWYEQRARKTTAGASAQGKPGMQARQAVDGGGVYVFELKENIDDGQVLEQLERLEREGIGEGRHLGFGQVCFFDPIHLQQELTDPVALDPERPKKMKDVIDRSMLVKAAEDLVPTPDAALLKVKKSQLNHLINICGDATCVAEIENYLRYQAGREATGWTVQVVNEVIASPKTAVDDVRDRAKKEATGTDPEALAVDAWRLFAVYLTRAYTYQAAVKKQRDGDGPGPRGQEGGQRAGARDAARGEVPRNRQGR